MKWAAAALALAIAWMSAIAVSTNSVAASDAIFVSPGEGSAGTRFQIVGESGWDPGETVTLDFAFSDVPPGSGFDGPFYNPQPVTVLRDGTWSFPVVINKGLVPFPLWRPGYIIVRATGAYTTGTATVLYTVEGRSPVAQPPLSGFGITTRGGPHGAFLAALFAFGAGLLLLVAALRDTDLRCLRERPQPAGYSRGPCWAQEVQHAGSASHVISVGRERSDLRLCGRRDYPDDPVGRRTVDAHLLGVRRHSVERTRES